MASALRRRSMHPALEFAKSERGKLSLPQVSFPKSSRSQWRSAKPEGGYGWIVVLASFIAHVLIDGRLYCMGSLYPPLQENFPNRTVENSWVMAVFVATVLGSGPLASAVDSIFGHIWTAFAGGVIATIGTFLTTFAQEPWHVILSFGILAGVGMGMTYLASVVAITDWFDKKKTLAMGIAVSGTGIGTFALNIGTTALYKALKWKGLFEVLTGLAAVSCFIAPLMRKPRHHSPRKSRRVTMAVEDKQSLKKRIKTVLKDAKNSCRSSFSLAMFKDWAFVVYMITDTLITVSIFIPYDFILARVQKELPHESEEALGWIPSIMGIATVVGQLAAGILSIPKLQEKADCVMVLIGVLLAHGTSAALSAFCTNYTHFALVAIVIGFLDGLIHTLTPIVCYEIASEELFISAWGAQMFLQGVGSIIGPVAGGALITFYGEQYWQTFVIFGIVMVVAGLILTAVPIRDHAPCCKKFNESDDSDVEASQEVELKVWMTTRHMTPRASITALPSPAFKVNRSLSYPGYASSKSLNTVSDSVSEFQGISEEDSAEQSDAGSVSKGEVSRRARSSIDKS